MQRKLGNQQRERVDKRNVKEISKCGGNDIF